MPPQQTLPVMPHLKGALSAAINARILIFRLTRVTDATRRRDIAAVSGRSTTTEHAHGI